MTESNSQLGGTAVAPPPTVVEPPADITEGNDANRRKLMIVGGIVLVVILAAAAYFLLFSKGSSSSSSFVSVPGGSPAAAAGPKAAAGSPAKAAGAKSNAGNSTVTLPKQSKRVIGRDPFAPLVTVPVVSSVTNPSRGSTAASPAPAGGTSTTSSGTTKPSSSSTSSQPVAPRVPVGVELVKVNGTKSATFEVFYNRGTKVETFTVDAPSSAELNSTGPAVFDTHFGFYSINDSTASVEYDSQSGDNFYTLTLHTVQKLS